MSTVSMISILEPLKLLTEQVQQFDSFEIGNFKNCYEKYFAEVVSRRSKKKFQEFVDSILTFDEKIILYFVSQITNE